MSPASPRSAARCATRDRQSPPPFVVEIAGLTLRAVEPGAARCQRSRDHEGGSDRHHAAGVERRVTA